MMPVLMAPVLGALLPLAVEVDFTAFPPRAAFPRPYAGRWVVSDGRGDHVDKWDDRTVEDDPAVWAYIDGYGHLRILGAHTHVAGAVVTITRVRDRPVAGVRYEAFGPKPIVRWVVRPDHLTAPPPKK